MNERGSTARPVGALIAITLSTFTYVTTETMPIGLLLLISKDLRSTPSAVGLLVTFYGLVVVVTSIPLTHLTRRVPRRFLLSGLLAIFIVATLASAVAPNYPVLLAVRVITALSQALFWSIVVPTATGMFPPKVRGRVVGMVLGGGSLATVLGVPAGTWLGQHAGWRMSFVALSGIGLLALIGVARLLPTEPPGNGAAARGVTPDARRYWLLMAMITLSVTGAFIVYTYVTPFLTDVGKFSLAAIGPLLLVRGVAGLVGVTAAGPLVDRKPWAAMVIPIVLQAVAMFGLFLFGDKPIAAIALLAASGLSFAALNIAFGSRVLQVAPGSVDLAAAGASTAVNVGITAGAFIGSILLPNFGVRSTTLVAGVLSLAALAIVLTEPLLASGIRQRESSPLPAAAPEPDLAPSRV